ncbi:MAG: excisionase family DNA-binding protein [Ignavibacterium sp.]|uniref:excisionase family DNA-binding protein n=1 Tax=Ignavibacterium sp. TaxID=2651167 RepID=UPI0040492072
MLIKLLPKDVFKFQDLSLREFFSVQEVAKLLNVSHSAVLYLIRSGNLRAVQVGKIYIIAKEDFGDFLKNQQKKKEKKFKKKPDEPLLF